MKQIRLFEYHVPILPSPKLKQLSVLEYIEVQKHIKPSTYASEIQHRLLLDGVVHPNDLPGTSQINRRLREDILFTKKKLKPKKPGALDRQNEYLDAVSRCPASKLHFCERAIEVLCYASNATFTINLLHSVVAVDYFNILPGPSNGLELLISFDEALQLNRCGIELIYQPPYSPHLNTCEYCFNQIKQFLQLHQLLAMNETKVAIGEAICHITAENLV
ncbi:hypothetical protein P5673_018904, partial [Acropora cervicornis]